MKDPFVRKLFLKLRKYVIIFFSGCLTSLIIIILLIATSSFTISKSLRALVPESKLTERIVERITEKELYRLLSPIIRLDVNEVVKAKTDYFIKEYTKIVGSAQVTSIIINKCLAKDIPVNVGLALSWRESGWDPNNTTQNTNKTWDRGLFKLNSAFHSKGTDWYNPEVNAEIGLTELKIIYDKYKSWEIAVTLFNAGSFGNLSRASLDHLTAILQKERELDSLFSDFYKSMGGT